MQQALIIGIIGLLAGTLSGMLGIGGAIFIIPALVMFLGFTQPLAQGTALGMMVLPVGLLAAWQYYQKGMVDVKSSLILGLFFLAGGYFGAKIAMQVPALLLKRLFAGLLIVIALKFLFIDKN